MTTEATDNEDQNPAAGQDQSVDVTNDNSAEDEDAAMEAAFSQVTGQPDARATVEQPNGSEQAAEAEPGESAEAQTTEGTPEIDAVGDALRKAEAAQEALEKLGKSNSSLQGIVGNLKQKFESLQAGIATKATPISKEAFKRLSTEFGEDFAEAMLEGLNATQLAQGVDMDKLTEQFDSRLKNELERRDREAIPRVLSREHKDWGGIVASPEWKAYTEGLPEDERTKLANTWDAYEIADHITAFKESKAKAEKAKASKVVKLTRAVTPQGPGTTGKPIPLTEDQAMEAGYKSARN